MKTNENQQFPILYTKSNSRKYVKPNVFLIIYIVSAFFNTTIIDKHQEYCNNNFKLVPFRCIPAILEFAWQRIKSPELARDRQNQPELTIIRWSPPELVRTCQSIFARACWKLPEQARTSQSPPEPARAHEKPPEPTRTRQITDANGNQTTHQKKQIFWRKAPVKTLATKISHFILCEIWRINPHAATSLKLDVKPICARNNVSHGFRATCRNNVIKTNKSKTQYEHKQWRKHNKKLQEQKQTSAETNARQKQKQT